MGKSQQEMQVTDNGWQSSGQWSPCDSSVHTEPALSLIWGKQGGSLAGKQKLEVPSGELITGLWLKKCLRLDNYSSQFFIPSL